MSKKLEQTWDFLNGKKTTIGAALLLIAVIIANMGAIWELDASWIPKIIQTLEWFGGLLAGTGLAHKGVKTIQA